MAVVKSETRAWELIRVIQRLSLAKSHEEIRDIVRHAARHLVDADGATFVIPEDGHCYYVDEDAISPLWKGSKFPLDTCISGWSMLHKQCAVIPNVFLDDRIPHDVYRRTFVKGMVMTPIRPADPLGAIGVYWAHEYEATPTEVQLLQALADTTAVAMESIETLNALESRVAARTKALDEANERLLEMSLTDELTSLRNRRGFELLAGHEYGLATRQNLPCAIAFVDVDGLKEINDALGHSAGDEAITVIGHALRDACRAADVVARFGGDEFAAFLISDETQTDEIVQRFQSHLDEWNATPDRDFDVRASVGIASRVGDESFDELVSRADSAMYRNKQVRKEGATAWVRSPW